MSNTFELEVVSAESSIFSGACNMVVAPGELGEMGIMPGHSPLLTRLKPGPLRILHEGSDEEVVFVSGGILEVQPNVVTVLADVAVRANDLDEAAAIEAKERSEKALQEKQGDFDYARAAAELAQAVAQIRSINVIRKQLKK